MIIINKININEKEMCDDYQNGVTTKELAEKYNCHYGTILRRLHKCNIETIYLPILPIDKISEKYQSGVSAKALAKKYNCNITVILRRLRDLKIDIRSHLEANQNMQVVLPEEKICKEYQDGMSLVKLGKKYNCSKDVIKRRLQKYNVRIRSRSESVITKLPMKEICKEYQDGVSSVKLAEKYNCERSTILIHLHKSHVKVRSIIEANVGQSEEARRKSSATKQGIPYDEWENFAKEKLYCPDYNEECRESNREKYGRKCFLTGLPEEENLDKTGKYRKLSVHHYDMDKGQGCDGKRWKLVPLCTEWHGKVHNELWKSRIVWLLENMWNSKL